MILSIFFAEVVVMFLLPLLPPVPLVMEAIIDSSILLILLSPTFYLLHYRPLLHHHLERKKIIDKLSTSQERLALTLDAVNDGLCDWNIETGHAYFSDLAETMLDFEPGEFGQDINCWRERIHPDDREAVTAKLEEHLQGKSHHFEAEHRLQKKEGDYIWVLTRGKVVTRSPDGKAVRMVGTHTDISKRKETEEALRKSDDEIRALTQRLITTSEEEKKHLAQDLHDEFGQVLTAFQFGVEMIRSHTYKDEEEFQFHCSRLLKMINTLEIDLRHICDHLRPIMLDDVGLIETLRWHIKEFILLDNNIEVLFQVHGNELPLERDVEIVCYRIMQEALNNIVKHSGAKLIEVKVEFRPQEIRLLVEDDGCGFAENKIRSGKRRVSGFGLLGMRERAAAVKGNVIIESDVDKGTKVQLIVPLQKD